MFERLKLRGAARSAAYEAELLEADARKARAQLQLSLASRAQAMFGEPSYTGASLTNRNLRGWQPEAGSGDADALDSLEMLRSRSRDLYRNDAIACASLEAKKSSVIGTGLLLQSQPMARLLRWNTEQAQDWARGVEDEFALWADNTDCDITRHDDFYGLQRLVFLSSLMSGDCFTLLPLVRRKGRVYDLRVKVIEADRCCNENNRPDNSEWAAGIKRDSDGSPLFYSFRQAHPGTWFVDDPNYHKWVKVSAFGDKTGRRNVLHHFVRVRPETARGVPILAPIMELCKQQARYRKAEVDAAVLNAFLAIFITRKTPGGDPLSDSFGEFSAMNGAVSVPPREKNEVRVAGASVIGLNDNEEIAAVDPKHPSGQFDVFIGSLCEQIGASIGVPKEILLKSFKASYSASRAALLEAWRHFNECRSWMVSSFCQPIYEEWLTEAVLKGRVRAPGFFEDPALRAAYCAASWVGPGMGQINPQQEAAGLLTLVEDLKILSRSEARGIYDGGDWESSFAQREWEDSQMRKSGIVETSPQPRKEMPEIKDDEE